MGVPGPPGWTPQSPAHPGPPMGPFPGPWPPPAPKRSGTLVALIVIVAALAVLLGGGGVYLATVSAGRYARPPYACGLIAPSELAQSFQHGLPSPLSAGDESRCRWSNSVAVNAGLERSASYLTVRVQRFHRGLFASAEKNARKEMSDQDAPGSVPRRHERISGYGDVSLRLVKAYGGSFDAIEFQVGNLVVEVAAEQDTPDGVGDDPNRSWATTQRVAGIIARRLA